MARQRLTNDVKIMIVTQLACFVRAPEIRDRLKAEFNLELGPSAIRYYDPDYPGSEVAKRWRDLFAATRATFLKEVGRVPIMNKAYRAHALQRILEQENERKNTVGARDTLKQAAEEEGGIFTNRRELTGADGKDLPIAAALTVQFVEPTSKAPTSPPTSEPANGHG